MAKKKAAAPKEASSGGGTAKKKAATKGVKKKAATKGTKKKTAIADKSARQQRIEEAEATADQVIDNSKPDQQSEFPGFLPQYPEHIVGQRDDWLAAKRAHAKTGKKEKERYAALLDSCLKHNEKCDAEGRPEDKIHRLPIPNEQKFVNVTQEDILKIETIKKQAKKDAAAASNGDSVGHARS